MLERQSARESLVWFLSGFLLATTWLFFFLGGFILMGLMLLAMPIAMLGVGLIRIAGMARQKVAPAEIAEVKAKAVAAPAVVGVKVMAASGTCNRGMRYEAGAVYTFANGKPTPEMCGPVVHAVQPVVQRVREGQPATRTNVICPLSGYALILDVFRQQEDEVELKRAA